MIGDLEENTRLGYSEFNAGDVEALSARIVPDFQWHEAQEIPGRKSCEDREEFLRYVRGFDLLWEDFSFEPLAIEAAGPDTIYARVRARGTGKASEEPVDFVIHHVWRLRDGLFARMDAYLDEADAREAARLPLQA